MILARTTSSGSPISTSARCTKGLQHAYHDADPNPEKTAPPQGLVVRRSHAPGEAATAMTSPSSGLLERFKPDQHSSFLGVRARPRPHKSEVEFDLHGRGWPPSAMEHLRNELCEFSDMLSTLKIDFGSFYLIAFEMPVQEVGQFQTPPHKPNTGQRSARCSQR